MSDAASGKLFCYEKKSVQMKTGSRYELILVSQTLKEKLHDMFITTFSDLRNAYKDDIRQGLKDIYGSRLSNNLLDELMDGKHDNNLAPQKVYVADRMAMKGANGCYVRDKQWILLRQDLAEKIHEKYGYRFEPVEIIQMVHNENSAYPRSFRWYG